MTVLQIGAYSLSVPFDLCLPRETPKDSEAHFTGARDKVLAVPFVAFHALGGVLNRSGDLDLSRRSPELVEGAKTEARIPLHKKPSACLPRRGAGRCHPCNPYQKTHQRYISEGRREILPHIA